MLKIHFLIMEKLFQLDKKLIKTLNELGYSFRFLKVKPNFQCIEVETPYLDSRNDFINVYITSLDGLSYKISDDSFIGEIEYLSQNIKEMAYDLIKYWEKLKEISVINFDTMEMNYDLNIINKRDLMHQIHSFIQKVIIIDGLKLIKEVK